MIEASKKLVLDGYMVAMQIIHDKKLPFKKYIVFQSIAELLEYIKETKVDFQVLQRGSDTVLRVDKYSQLVLKNHNYNSVIEKLLENHNEQTHKLTLATAEYHTYLEISDTNGKEKFTFGGAPKNKGSKLDYLTIRNDSYYPKKYYAGNKPIEPDSVNPHFNKGSASITFPITAAQFSKVLEIAKSLKEEFDKSDHRFDITGNVGNNCADIANKIINDIGIHGKIIDFYKVDELDMRDQGTMYLVWSDLGTVQFMYYLPYHFFDNISFVVTGKTIDEQLEYLASKIGYYNFFPHTKSPLIPHAYNDNSSEIDKYLSYIDATNAEGDTILHIALKYNNVNFAKVVISKGIDINIENNRGETALHIAAKMPASKDKYEVLEILSKSSRHINDVDSLNSATPLTNAVISDDSSAVEILLKNGANASYVNANMDNLANIVVNYGAYKVLNLINKYDPSLIYHDNLEHQIPICEVARQKDPSAILENFEEMWSSFDKGLCKEPAQLSSALEL